MTIDWVRFRQILDSNERFLLTTHVSPDGDALGSETAMCELLRSAGKTVDVVNPSATPQRYTFLDPDQSFRAIGRQVAPADIPQPDVLIMLDTGAWTQLGKMADVVRATSAKKVIIDHHVKQEEDIGAELFVDSSAVATGAILLDAFNSLDQPMNLAAARGLFVAIAMDSGWLRFEKTTGDTYRAMARLVDAGVNPYEMHLRLNQCNRVERLQLLGRVLDHIETTHGGRVAHSSLSLADFQETGAHYDETEDMIQLVQSVLGADAAAMFIEKKSGEVKVSLRSQGALDCNHVASLFGGGGHRAASGATLAGPIDAARARVLEALGHELADCPAPGS